MALKGPFEVAHKYLGLSTDTKPTVGIDVGDEFLETDTAIVYIFNGVSWVVKPGGLTTTGSIIAATTAVAGKVELATNNETITGTDTARAITPANLAAKLAAPGAIGATTPAAGTFTGLGVGTSTPHALLEIYNPTGLSSIRIDNGANNLGSVYTQLQFFAGASQGKTDFKNFALNNANASYVGAPNTFNLQRRKDDGTFGASLFSIMANGRIGFNDPVLNRFSSFTISGLATGAITGTGTATIGTNTVEGTGTLFAYETAVGDKITLGAETKTITGVTDNDTLIVDSNWAATHAGVAITITPGIFSYKDSSGVVRGYINNLGDVEIGSSSGGNNLIVNATLGAEMTPALEAANWTATDGWSAGSGQLVKIAGAGTGTATPSGAFSVVAGTTYKVVIICSAVSGTLTYTLGGVGGTAITATTIADYITASTTGKIIFSGGAAVTATITSVSVKAVAFATGDALVQGNLTVDSAIKLPAHSSSSYPQLRSGSPSNAALGGFNFLKGGQIDYVSGGSIYARFDSSGVMIPALSIGSQDYLDTLLQRDAAGIVGQRSGATQQAYKIYNLYSGGGANYERLSLSGVAGASVNITAETAGTGADNLDLVLNPAGSGVVRTGPNTTSGYIYLGTSNNGRLYMLDNVVYLAGASGLELRVASGVTKIVEDSANVSATGYTGGGLARRIAEATVALSGASGTITLSIPSGARLLGVQLRVDVAIASGDGATSWTAAYSGGSSTALVTGQAFTKNTKANKMHVDEITTDVTNIIITPNSGTFSSGTVRAVAYYEDFIAMSDAQ